MNPSLRYLQSRLWILLSFSFFLYGSFLLIDDFRNIYVAYIMVFSFVCNWLAHQCILHRYFTHRPIKVKKLIEEFLYFISITASTGSVYSYRYIHTTHHRYADSERDLIGPNHGIFHLIKILFKNQHILRRSNNKSEDFNHNHYFTIQFLYSLILFTVSWELFVFYCFTIWIWLFITGFYNYVNHLEWFPGNYRNFDTRDRSHNNVFWDLWSGTWHNNHHHRPSSETDQVKWWEVDLVYWLFIKPLKRYEEKL